MRITGKHTNPKTGAIMYVRAIGVLSFSVRVQHPNHEKSGDMGHSMSSQQIGQWIREWTAV